LANFERLIRGALASQDSSSADVRQLVYQSSRNALQKIIDNNRSLTLESVMEQKKRLEASIKAIEAEFSAPPIKPSSPSPEFEEFAQAKTTINEFATPTIDETPTVAEDEDIVSPASAVARHGNEAPKRDVPVVAKTDPLHEIQQILESTSPTQQKSNPSINEPVDVQPAKAPVPEPDIPGQFEQIPPQSPDNNVESSRIVSDEIQPVPPPDSGVLQSEQIYHEEQENVPLEFAKRRKTQKRFIWTMATLAVLALLAWSSYVVLTGVMNGSLFGQNDPDGPRLNPNSLTRQAESENYITILEASDASALVTANRGRAEIIRELNSDMLRINSVRNALNRGEPALPLLIRLKPGVLQQISGKRVTVEIFAKSGGSDKASYAVGCEFGGQNECGRKRFLVGPQPEASVFAFEMGTISDLDRDMYLSLSTDTTSEAAITGKGDILDIVYIRLRADN